MEIPSFAESLLIQGLFRGCNLAIRGEQIVQNSLEAVNGTLKFHSHELPRVLIPLWDGVVKGVYERRLNCDLR